MFTHPFSYVCALAHGIKSFLFEIYNSGPIEETKKIVNDLANDGLRTLVYGFKIITREDLNFFSEKLETARQSIVNRIKYVRAVYKEMEKDFTLLGATGIEDKLQVCYIKSYKISKKEKCFEDENILNSQHRTKNYEL